MKGRDILGNSLKLWIGKLAVAGILAYIALSVFSVFYDSYPIKMNDENGVTDDRWQPNSFYSQMKEGLGYGKTDKNGYINLPEAANAPADVLIMGTSHMEGIQLPQEKIAASLMNEKLDGLNVYNIGTPGLDLLKSAQNIEAAIKTYNPSYIVIETHDVVYGDEKIKLALDGDLPKIRHESNFIRDNFSKIPFIRMIWKQVWTLINLGTAEGAGIVSDANRSLMAELLLKAGGTAAENGVKLIIFYHPYIGVNQEIKEEDAEAFSLACEEAGIVFVNMTDRFLDEYKNNYILPHGFANSNIGAGHLNTDGHAMVADELVKTILKLEG